MNRQTDGKINWFEMLIKTDLVQSHSEPFFWAGGKLPNLDDVGKYIKGDVLILSYQAEGTRRHPCYMYMSDSARLNVTDVAVR